MATVTIRKLSEETKGLLAQRASRRRHSLEEELRQILDEAARTARGCPRQCGDGSSSRQPGAR